MKFYLNGKRIDPPETNAGVYEVVLNPGKRLPRKLKKKFKLKHRGCNITFINDWLRPDKDKPTITAP